MKKVLLAILLVVPAARAQTLDDFYGLVAAPCSSLNNEQAATLSQNSGSTTVTAVVTTGSAYWVGEYIRVLNANATLNTVFNGASATAGADTITGIASNTLTMTSPVTAGSTQTNVAGNVAADYFYTSPSIVTPSWGTRSGFCTPEGHWYYSEVLSDASSGPSSTLNFSYTPTSNTASSGVVTMAFGNNWVTQGMRIVISSCSDANYNGTFQVTAASTASISYVDASAGASATGCTLGPYKWDQYKYNSGATSGIACAGAMGQLQRLVTLGFNGIGEDSDAVYLPNGGCTPPAGYTFTPFFTGVGTPAVSRYAQINLWGCGPQGLKDPTYALDRSLTGLTESDFDWFDPNWPTFIACAFGGTTHQVANVFNSPYLIGITVDDTDGMGQTRSGQWWHPTGSTGATAVLPSLMIMYAPPQITASNQSIYGGNANSLPTLYAINTVYSKALSSTQPAGCWADTAGTTPGGNPAGPSYGFCTISDWLRNQHGTIANLNSAWGSTYTTFGSSQSSFANESHAFTDTALAHSNVTPRSVSLYLTPSGGSAVMVGGDCQANATDCAAGTAGTGQLLAPGNCYNSTGSFYGSTGIVCVDGNGSIEEVTTAGEETSVATWPAASSAACSGTQTTTNGGVVFTCIGPHVSGSITYSSGVVSFTAGGAGSLPTGEVFSVSYKTGGWDAGGTGLLDEDGSHTWTTTNGACLISPPAWQASHAYTAYDDGSVVQFQVASLNYYAMATQSFTSGSSAPAWVTTPGTQVSDGSTANAWVVLGKPPSDPNNGYGFNVACGTNAAFAADMNAWVETFIGKYLSTVQTAFKSINPSLLDFGANFGSNDWTDPTWEGALKAESLYTDAGFWGEFANGGQTLDPQTVWKENYAFTYFKKPVYIEEFESANNWETLVTCNGQVNCWANPVARDQGFYAEIHDFMTYTAPGGSSYFAGVTWWTDHCGNAAGSACFGLFDNDDNRLDGSENVTATVACSQPLGSLSCGKEYSGVPWLNENGDTVSQGLTQALALWTAASCPAPGAGFSICGSGTTLFSWVDDTDTTWLVPAETEGGQ